MTARFKLVLLLLGVAFLPSATWAQGGPTCAAAQANPLTIPFNLTNQSTCNSPNNFTGASGNTCLSSTAYYTGKNYYYYFCATQPGFVTINATVTTTNLAAYPNISIYSGCPTSGGQCLGAVVQYIPSNSTATMSIAIQVNPNQCYFIMLDSYFYSGYYANCFNFSLNSQFTPIATQPSCTNMDFETGNLNGWICTTGRTTIGCGTCPTPVYSMSAVGVVNNRHTIMTGGNDPCGGFPRVAPGGTRSLRLGNNINGSEGERVLQRFMVSQSNASFTYKYAVVFEDPGHLANEQPFFRAVLYDQNGNVIPCSEFIVSAAANIPGFFNSTSCSGVRYKPWSTVNVDLSNYIGQPVTVEFTTGDCVYSGHYGYAYVDAKCDPSLLSVNDTICQGQCSNLSAPPGYASYQWQPGNFNTPSINVCPTITTVYTLTLTAFNQCQTIVKDTVFVNPLPVPAFSFPTPACNVPVTFTPTVTVPPPSTIASYNWTFQGGTPSSSTSANPPPVSWSTPGTYNVTLTVTTSAGCTASVTMQVVIPTCVFAVQLPSDTICTGSCANVISTVIGGVPTFTYSWTPNIGNGPGPYSVCPTTTTTYSVLVTDATGNTATATSVISVVPPMTILLAPTHVTCAGAANGSIVSTVSGGWTPYTYLWNTGQTTSSISGLSNGNYSLVVTNAGGCTASASIAITEPPPLNATVSSTNVTCFGFCNGTANVSVSGGTAPYTYSWSTTPSQSTANVSSLCAGTYTVTVTDLNSCSLTRTVAITQPSQLVATTSFTQATCGQCNGTVTVTASGGTGNLSYSWNSSPNQSTSTATGLCPGTYVVTITDLNGCTRTASSTVPNTSGPTVTATSTNVTCFGACNGTATSTVNGGVPPINISWNTTPVQNTTGISGLCPGIYIVTATDANGCTATASVTITEPTQLVYSTVDSNVTCFGACNGSSQILPSGGTPGYLLVWNTSPATSNMSVSGLCAGTYTVQISDANQCTTTGTVTITEPPVLNLNTAGFSEICPGACNGQGVVIASGGTLPYTYAWSNGSSTASVQSLCNGVYNVVVTDVYGCSASDTAIVASPPGIQLNIDSSRNATCFGAANGAAWASATGGTGNLTYAWNTTPVQNSNAATNLPSGTYQVTVTDQNGCSTTTTVIISEPPPIVLTTSQNNVTCFGLCNGDATVASSGGTAPYTYAWSTTPSQISATATGLCASQFQVVITDANQCTMSTSVTITEPQLLTVNAIPVNTICNLPNGAVSAQASGGTSPYTFAWSNAQSGPSISALAAGVYSVIVTDINGCTALASATVLPSTLPDSSFTVVSDTGCGKVCVVFNANATGLTYLWNFGDGGQSTLQNPTHCYDSVGTFTVTLTVTDANGCVNSSTQNSVVTVYPTPVAAFTISPSNTTILSPVISFTDQSQGATQWLWTFDETTGATSTLQNPQYTYNDTGTYCVTLSVANQYGCTDTAINCLTIGPDFTFYAPNAFTPQGDGINDFWTPKGIGIDPSTYELYIYDRWGNMIFTTTVWGRGWDGRVQGGHSGDIVQEDVYVWKVIFKDIVEYKRHEYIGHVTVIK